MSAEALAPTPDSVHDLAEFASHYSPATPEENLLISHAWRAWSHLQQIYALYEAIVAQRGIVALFNDDFARYKQLNRDLAQAERMWNRAIAAFWQARKRQGAAPPQRVQPAAPPPPEPPQPEPVAAAAPSSEPPTPPDQPPTGPAPRRRPMPWDSGAWDPR
ncbi:MAG: hypothetical protein JSU00_27890 [Acidobacteria bacterium]|nr:hypothetical protein [Acidobacteriota bacterium]